MPHLLDGAACSDAVVHLGGIGVHTHAVAHPPPAGQVGLDAEVAGEALGIVGHLVLVHKPVGVVGLIPRVETGAKHAVARAVLVEIVAHVAGGTPVVHTIEGTGALRAVEGCTGQGLGCARVAVGGIGPEGEYLVLLLAVEAEGGLGVARGGHHAILVVVGTREVEVAVLGAAAHAQVGIPHAGCLEEVAGVVVGGSALGHAVAPRTVGEVVKHGARVILVGIILIFHVTTPVGLLLLGQVAHPAGDVVGIEVDLDAAFLTLLGGDDHHAVGSAAAIECRCGRALEHAHVLNVLGVDIHHAVRRGGGAGHRAVEGRVAHNGGRVVVDHTVDHKQRLVVAVLRTRGAAAQDDLRACTCCTARLGDVDTGNLARERVDGIGVLVLHQLFRVDVVDCIAQGFLVFLDAESRHHHLVEVGRVRHHLHIDCRASHWHLHGLVAYVGNHQCAAWCCLDRVLAVDIGSCCHAGAFHLHGCTYQRFSIGISHDTSHFTTMALRHCREAHAGRHCRQSSRQATRQ